MTNLYKWPFLMYNSIRNFVMSSCNKIHRSTFSSFFIRYLPTDIVFVTYNGNNKDAIIKMLYIDIL